MVRTLTTTEDTRTAVSAANLLEGDIIRWEGVRFLVEAVDLDGDIAVILVSDSSGEDSDLGPLEILRDTLIPIVA